jgi:hypothetical protein
MRPEKKFNDPLLQRLYDTLEWLYECHGVSLGINAIGGAIDANPEDVILHLKARIFVSECYQMERACLRDQLSGNKRVDEDPEECDTCFHRMFKRGKGWLCCDPSIKFLYFTVLFVEQFEYTFCQINRYG